MHIEANVYKWICWLCTFLFFFLDGEFRRAFLRWYNFNVYFMQRGNIDFIVEFGVNSNDVDFV